MIERAFLVLVAGSVWILALQRIAASIRETILSSPLGGGGIEPKETNE